MGLAAVRRGVWQRETYSGGVLRGDLRAPSVRFSDGANDHPTESGATPGAGCIAAGEAFKGVVGNGAIKPCPESETCRSTPPATALALKTISPSP